MDISFSFKRVNEWKRSLPDSFSDANHAGINPMHTGIIVIPIGIGLIPVGIDSMLTGIALIPIEIAPIQV